MISEINKILRDSKPVRFEDLIEELNEYNGLIDVKRVRSCTYQYKMKDLIAEWNKCISDAELQYKEKIPTNTCPSIEKIEKILRDSNISLLLKLKNASDKYIHIIHEENTKRCVIIENVKDLIKKLNKFDESVFVHDIIKKYIEFINLRNASIRKKIKIYCTDLYGNNEGNAPSFYMPLTHNEYMKINFRSLECPNIIIIDKNQNVKSSISPAKVGLFHELLHLYHYIKNPLIVHLFKEDIAYSMITSSYKNAIDDKNCEHIDLILYPKDEQFHISNTDDSLIINLEEFLTIRGKSETTYYLSENSYRLENDEFLRYSIFGSPKLPDIDNVSKSLYDKYHIVASTSKRGL